MGKVKQIFNKIKEYINKLKDKSTIFFYEHKPQIKKIALVAFYLFLCFKFFETFIGYYVVAKFEELGALGKNMPVYYRGYRIGKSKSVTPSDDYKYTYVRLRLHARKLKLPNNVVAKVKKSEGGKNYIEIVYPKEASEEILKRGNEIKGETTFDIKSFISSQINSGALDAITENTAKTLSSVEKTSDEVRGLISDIRDILAQNRENIKKTTDNAVNATENFSLTMANINDISLKLNESLERNTIKSSITNVEQTTENIKSATKNVDNSSLNIEDASKNIKDATKNIKNITENIDNATKNFYKTMEGVNNAVDQASATTENLNKITSGVHSLLQQRFAGLKIFFGKPIDTKNVQRTCQN